MRVHPWHTTVPVGLLLLIPLLVFAQEAAPREKQTPKENAPKPRVDLYGDPLPEGAIARMRTTPLRFDRLIGALASSPDRNWIAAWHGPWVDR